MHRLTVAADAETTIVGYEHQAYPSALELLAAVWLVMSRKTGNIIFILCIHIHRL